MSHLPLYHDSRIEAQAAQAARQNPAFSEFAREVQQRGIYRDLGRLTVNERAWSVERFNEDILKSMLGYKPMPEVEVGEDHPDEKRDIESEARDIYTPPLRLEDRNYAFITRDHAFTITYHYADVFKEPEDTDAYVYIVMGPLARSPMDAARGLYERVLELFREELAKHGRHYDRPTQEALFRGYG